MFFKQDHHPHAKKYADTACFVTFVFWGFVLLLNYTGESFFGGPFVSNSLHILLAGLAVFFSTDLLLRIIKRA
ncbi:hypothetical protein [Jeotgalibacillus campisalis]|uniref:Uncharacterized protein n=1 Tax=Jeotgalibacillus campisalis TaxID=220754 RepID=A0A0C2RLG2_9BACL|nr:hypothetical protein [Jeotgalibacillus campisalis]KIL51070.1 hypothetical protein KR50_09510 [Jeotgalibacillus campisalis]